MYRRASSVSWCRHARWADTTERGKENSKQYVAWTAAWLFGFDRLLRVRVLYCTVVMKERGRAPATGATESEIQINRHLSLRTRCSSAQPLFTIQYSSSLLVLLDYPTIFKFIDFTPQIKTILFIFVRFGSLTTIGYYEYSRLLCNLCCKLTRLLMRPR